jgi:hypothetical protein
MLRSLAGEVAAASATGCVLRGALASARAKPPMLNIATTTNTTNPYNTFFANIVEPP